VRQNLLAPVILSALAGLALAVASAWYERIGPAPPGWSQEICSYDPPRSCRDGVLLAGWPLPYLIDAPGVSRVGTLSIWEDHFRPWSFAADALAASVVVWLLGRLLLRSPR
jgi:hypothetical protein